MGGFFILVWGREGLAVATAAIVSSRLLSALPPLFKVFSYVLRPLKPSAAPRASENGLGHARMVRGRRKIVKRRRRGWGVVVVSICLSGILWSMQIPGIVVANADGQDGVERSVGDCTHPSKKSFSRCAQCQALCPLWNLEVRPSTQISPSQRTLDPHLHIVLRNPCITSALAD